MKLIFALGNPESRYDGTRHNTGFAAIDAWTARHDAAFGDKPKFKAHLASLTVDGEKVLAAKPTTYYNLVGESYRAILDFYQIAPEDTLIVHDDLALDLGTIRTRDGGSDAGNNGIKSINAHGGEHSQRLRVGIASGQRDQRDDTDFVLGKFSAAEQAILDKMQPKIAEILDDFISGNHEITTHRADK